MNAIFKSTALAVVISTLTVGASYAAQPAQLNPYFQAGIGTLTYTSNLGIQDPQFNSFFRYYSAGNEAAYFAFNGYPGYEYHWNETQNGITHSNISVGVGENAKECVAFIRAVGDNIPPSWSWIPASWSLSMGNIPPPYSIIATFNGNTYSGHVAIFIASTWDGIYVMDQNYGKTFPGRIAYHTIPWFGGSGVGNAYNYRVVYHN